MHSKRFIAFVLCLLFLAQGCSRKSEGDTIRIGVITSLTGSLAAFGEAHKHGYEIALDELNAKGGVLGKKIELDFYDDQSKSDQAVQGVSKLIDQDRVPLILGSYSSESTKAIVPSMIQRQVPLIIPTATADNVMDSRSPWIFRVCAGAADYARATLAFLKSNGAPKTMAIVYENTNFGQANMKAMTAAANEAGIKLVAVESYEAKSPDYKAVLQRVKKANPDVIYFCSYLLDATTLMRQAQEVDLNPQYYTSAGTGFAAAEFPTPKGAGKNAEYTFSTSQWLPEAKWTGSREFDAEYFKRYNSHPAYHATQAYASLRAAVQAIDDAKSTDPAKIKDALHNLNISMTLFGPIKFDANGQNQHPVLVTQVQGGQYRVVNPPDVADAKPIIPAPKWSQR
ncbi:MAG TPA: ABC transporter substrate-binding protein [Verrucomicrobiae bacterium]|jgi:branched-chain amino acid transport system substrate-binding protein|nr:ABC transporter substrate-binding protein [Verrucomicrobiae bacterium]